VIAYLKLSFFVVGRYGNIKSPTNLFSMEEHEKLRVSVLRVRGLLGFPCSFSVCYLSIVIDYNLYLIRFVIENVKYSICS